MPTVTELADQVERSNNRLTTSIDRLSNEFSEFRRQVTTRLEAIDAHLKWAKWIGVTLAGMAVAAIGYTHQAVRHVTHLEDTVITMQQSVLALQQSAKERDSQFIKAVEAIERIEQSHTLNQPLPKVNP
jgi:membrane protein required for beta-lactamase induction